ncbi:MAG: hypothetical protein NZ811_02815 [Gammaproteobacteria bacterium]|nr:hypothetical protein [Gammaproteobacteria bacterium]
MERIRDFISESERLELLKWVDDNRGNLKNNPAGPHRKNYKVKGSINNDIALKIEDRIKDRFNLNKDNVERQWLGSFLSIISNKGFVHTHRDPTPVGEHHRFNLIIQKPEKGGTPVYAGEGLEWENGDLLCYRPDINFHGSEVVQGDLERIAMSCGWIIL